MSLKCKKSYNTYKLTATIWGHARSKEERTLWLIEDESHLVGILATKVCHLPQYSHFEHPNMVQTTGSYVQEQPVKLHLSTGAERI